MPAVLAIPAFWAAVGTTAAAGGMIVAGHEQASGQTNAAKIQSDAQLGAAKIQDDATQRTEAFQRAQAENTYQNSEVSRRGNYDQWVAAQHRLGTVGQLLGMPDREIPAYVPTIDPRYTSAGTAAPPVAGAPAPGAAPGASATPSGAPGVVDGSAASISNYFKSKGVSDQETPYWVTKWPELVARGQQLNDPNYAMTRLSQADIFGGAAKPAQPQTALPGAVADYFGGIYPTVPTTPALQMPAPVAKYWGMA